MLAQNFLRLRIAAADEAFVEHTIAKSLRLNEVLTAAIGATSTALPRICRTWMGRVGGKLSPVDWVIATGEHETIVQNNRDFSGASVGERHSELFGDLGRRLRPRLAVVEREPAPLRLI